MVVEDEVGPNHEEALGSDRLDANLLSLFFRCSLFGVLASGGLDDSPVVRQGGEVGLRLDGGNGPGLSAVVGESEIRSILFWPLVVAAGNGAVQRILEGDGEDSGGVGAVEDRGLKNLPGLPAIGGVEDASGGASGGEPQVLVGEGRG